MNNSSKVPPRFVPTLTEVVPSEVGEAAAEPQGVEPALDQAQVDEEAADAAATAPLASFHSPWLADGLYVRSRPATIPHDLPPLPESLPPQLPFSSASTDTNTSTGSFVESESEEDEESHFMSEAVVETEPALKTEDLAPAPEAVQLSEEIYAEPDSSEAETLVWNAEAPQVTEEYLVHRLMQRVDLVLEQRLKEAIAIVVQEQTRSLLPRLREEVESVVRQSVYEAVESELAQQNKLRPEKN